MARALAAAGLNSQKVQILGTGLWNDARVSASPALQGAWFAAPENAGFQAFAQRYRAKFGCDPTRIATLGYDAVSLVIALAKRAGPDRFSENVLTSSVRIQRRGRHLPLQAEWPERACVWRSMRSEIALRWHSSRRRAASLGAAPRRSD